MTTAGANLLPWQTTGVTWLSEHPSSYLADEAGLGKTRQLLCAAEGKTLVVTKASIRDTRVFEQEAEAIGIEPPPVWSYQRLAKEPVRDLKAAKYRTVIVDEATALKNRKGVSWTKNAELVIKYADRVHLASGDPMPNAPWEIWYQQSLIDPETDGSFWRFVEQWWPTGPDPHGGPHSKKAGDRMHGCRCSEDDIDSLRCPHFAEMARAIRMDQWMLRRLQDEVWADRPPLTGTDTPLWTPMAREQQRVYNEMKKQLFAELPTDADGNVIVEAMSHSGKYQNLRRISTGLASLDPRADWRQSGKMAAFAEALADRGRGEHTLVGVHYHDTAAAVMKACDSLGLTWVPFSGRSTPAQKLRAKDEFQAGRFNVMIASVQAVKEGITLTRADQTHLLERPDTPGDINQVIRRIYRIGQERPVAIRQWVTPKSPDELQWHRVWSKGRRIRATISVAELKAIL